jgi:hypothetical protein
VTCVVYKASGIFFGGASRQMTFFSASFSMILLRKIIENEALKLSVVV